MASLIAPKSLAIMALALALHVQGIIGGKIECENLSKDSCAFAVSSTGKRCVLERMVRRSGSEEYTCKASEIEADMISGWIETDQCIRACGLDRTVLGISSDSLLEPHVTQNLCSHGCYGSCPNIVDLYFNLAVGEGVYLPELCKAQGNNPRRGMAEIRSSGVIAPGPGSEDLSLGKYEIAPIMAPTPN